MLDIDTKRCLECIKGQTIELTVLDDEESAWVAAELHMPAGSRMARRVIRLPDTSGSSDNYSLVSIGRIVPHGQGRESSRFDQADIDPNDYEFESWLDQVHFTDSALYVETRWTPDGDQTAAMRGDFAQASKREIERATRDLAFLRHFHPLVKRGRPPGSGRIQDPQEVKAAYAEYFAQHGKRPSQEDLAAHMACDTSTLKRFLHDNSDSLSWPPT